MTSTDSKKGAALAAKDIMSIAPMAKFGAISTPTPAPLLAGGAQSCPRRASEPCVVPAGRADDDVHAALDTVRDVAG